jgi:DNA polymerase III subunit beta
MSRLDFVTSGLGSAIHKDPAAHPMKLLCAQSDFSSNLSLVSRAVPARPGLPILANILLTADAGTQRVSLTGFDQTLGIQTSFAAQVESSGAITLPAKLLTDIVSRLPNESQVTLEHNADDPIATLSARGGCYQVNGLSAEDFPELPLVQSGEALSVATEALMEGLRGTLFATSGDETKQVLTGIHLTVRADSLEFAATDGHRLAVVTTENTGADSAVTEFEVTVPARALRDLEKMISSRNSGEPIALYYDQGQTVFQCGDQYITSRTLEGQYPNYNQLIPKQFERQVTLDRKLLLSALERIAVMADQKNNVVKLSLDSEGQLVTLHVEAQDVGSGQESLPAQISGESLDIAFNVRYLMDGLKAVNSGDVQLQLNSATGPVILSPLGAIKMIYLVMPVQIRG